MAFTSKDIEAAKARRAARDAGKKAQEEKDSNEAEPPYRPKRLVMVPKPEKEESIDPPQYTTHSCPECGEEMLDNQANCTQCGYFEGEVSYGTGPELTQAQRQRIYLEEKAKIEARNQIEARQKAQGCLLFLIIAFGFWIFTRLPSNTGPLPQKSSSSQPGAKYTPTDPPSRSSSQGSMRSGERPAIQVSAANLYTDYEANEVAADEQYKGKVLEVAGVVDSVGKDILNHMYVALSIGQRYQVGRVQCFFSDAYQDKLARIQKGQVIHVRGRCMGKMINVVLHDCTLGSPYGP